MIGKVLFLFVLILMYKWNVPTDIVIGVSSAYWVLSLIFDMAIAYYFPQFVYDDDEREDE